MSLRILIADDHRMFVDGLVAVLGREPDLEVVGRVRDGREAVALALRLEPDLVVMDASMPVLNGIEATRQIVAERPQIRVLCLSMHRERQYLSAALAAGAAGYVLKDEASENLIAAMRHVAGGGIYLSPEMAAAAADEYRKALASRRAPSDPALTEREREVLQLVAEGHTSHEIAAVLGVSERTVATHRRHIAKKLDIHSVAGLTKYAIRHGLTTAERDSPDSRPRKP